uniref:Golgi associated, gamma adaptin ear containing, ARF binding protein 1 n=1 Tax=Pseudonaja textilis TaxID=8673 RepID=A0A670XXJ2_PSETE
MTYIFLCFVGIEAVVNRATNPLNKDVEWDNINAFCDQLNKELEGPPLATRLLAHKIQSPQEWEAIQALTVLEACMKNCGKRFHDEVGKFRFLNELIKVVSPKYLGNRTPEKVKSKILELMYSWTLGLPEEVKITEAYQMLKKQGIVKCDPKLPDDAPFPLPPPRPKNAIFDDEEKSKMLARLLKSSHPEDLRAANKLIKEMVQEDQKRMEKISKRVHAIEEVNNNVKLLTDMVTNYTNGEMTESSEDLMKELYQRCERMRPMLFRLASDTEDNDEALAEILQANDNLTQVINLYKQIVKGEEINGETMAGSLRGSTSALLDLSGLDMPPANPAYPAIPTFSGGSSATVPEQSSSVSLLDDELMSLVNILSYFMPLLLLILGNILPVTVYDQHGFRVLFHFAKDSLPDRPDVLVVVISMLSTAPLPIRNIIFQSAVPKVMKVKLQPPSGTELPPFNPIVPPTAITQVLLLANPQKEKVRLRYKLTFTMADQTYNEMGDVDQFPPPESWGNL